MQRRTFIAATAGVAASTVMFPAFQSNAAFTPRGGAPFRPLPELDASSSFSLSAEIGSTRFADGASSETLGFNGAYLGPTLRMRRGQVPKATVRNTTDNPISVHWHGLNVPSNVDGGSHRSAVVPSSTRDFELPIDQPAATLWYHTHVHGRTAPDVHAGLAGAIILDDDESDALGLPSTPGIDDLVLVLQDKSFDGDGRATYDPGMMGVMHGVVGDYVLANGQLVTRCDRSLGSCPPSVDQCRHWCADAFRARNCSGLDCDGSGIAAGASCIGDTGIGPR